jgi:hypothetical protein
VRNRMTHVASVVRTLDFRAGERATPCACGGYVVANPTNDLALIAAMRAHQRTLRHLDWWARAGW